MKLYRIDLTVGQPASAIIKLEAENEKEAIRLAKERFLARQDDFIITDFGDNDYDLWEDDNGGVYEVEEITKTK